MIELFSTEFWIAILFIISFFLVVFLFMVVKRVNGLEPRGADQSFLDDDRKDSQHASRSASEIIDLLEPLVEESRNVATRFDEQIQEKKRLIKELNDALDSRIISINLLLSRSDALQKKLEDRQTRVPPSFPPGLNSSSGAVLDQQNQIIDMFHKNFDINDIAQTLSIPKGEVQLVIDLKKKFVAMEKGGR